MSVHQQQHDQQVLKLNFGLIFQARQSQLLCPVIPFLARYVQKLAFRSGLARSLVQPGSAMQFVLVWIAVIWMIPR